MAAPKSGPPQCEMMMLPLVWEENVCRVLVRMMRMEEKGLL